ncbi:MAG: phage coat protein [Clostridia bacterium]|nr:phage coat protein [Clostridia bacterium]
MANTKFDEKSFNPEAFLYKQGRVPNLKMHEIVKSRAVVGDNDVKTAFSSQNGTAYARLAVKGLIDGDAVNYDGQTDITATRTKTFEQGYVVVGRAKGWVETDFSDEISDEDFMDNVIAQTGEYWDDVNNGIILAAIKGVFSMTGAKNLEFVNNHTFDITGNSEAAVGATTLNSAMNKACKANKKKFTLVFVHPDVSTNLENLKLLVFMKYTDKDNITRDLSIGTWSGRTVIVTDEVPVDEVAAVYEATSDTEVDATKTYYTRDGAGTTESPYTYTVVDSPVKADLGTYYEVTEDAYLAYTTYILGDGAITYQPVSVNHPASMARDEAKNGGETTLYNRQRHALGVKGISYEKVSQATLSPENDELADGANWELVHSGEAIEANRSYIDHKAIPIARIISKG